MKTVTGLNDHLLPLSMETEAEKADLEKMPTFKKMIASAIGQPKARNADESRRIGRLLEKLRASEKEIALFPEDLKLIIDLVEINEMGMIASIHGQVLLKLGDAQDIPLKEGK